MVGEKSAKGLTNTRFRITPPYKFHCDVSQYAQNDTFTLITFLCFSRTF